MGNRLANKHGSRVAQVANNLGVAGRHKAIHDMGACTGGNTLGLTKVFNCYWHALQETPDPALFEGCVSGLGRSHRGVGHDVDVRVEPALGLDDSAQQRLRYPRRAGLAPAEAPR